MAGWLGVEVGSYHHWSDSLHVYAKDAAKFSCEPEGASLASNTDSLAIDMARGEAVILDLYRRMVEMTAQEVGVKALEELAFSGGAGELPEPAARARCRVRAKTRPSGPSSGADAWLHDAQLLQTWSAWSEQMGGGRRNVA